MKKEKESYPITKEEMKLIKRLEKSYTDRKGWCKFCGTIIGNIIKLRNPNVRIHISRVGGNTGEINISVHTGKYNGLEAIHFCIPRKEWLALVKEEVKDWEKSKKR